MDFLIKLIEVLLFPCLSYLMLQVVKYLEVKRSQIAEDADKAKYQAYYDGALEAITKSVVMVNQTFVESLKKQGKFDAEAQEEAFQDACETAMILMGEEVVEFLQDQMDNFGLWLKVQVEASVNENK